MPFLSIVVLTLCEDGGVRRTGDFCSCRPSVWLDGSLLLLDRLIVGLAGSYLRITAS